MKEVTFNDDIAVLALATRSSESWDLMVDRVNTSYEVSYNWKDGSKIGFSKVLGKTFDFSRPEYHMWFEYLRHVRKDGYKTVVCDFNANEAGLRSLYDNSWPVLATSVQFMKEYFTSDSDAFYKDPVGALEDSFRVMLLSIASVDLSDAAESAGEWSRVSLFNARKVQMFDIIKTWDDSAKVDMDIVTDKLREVYVESVGNHNTPGFKDTFFIAGGPFDDDDSDSVLEYAGAQYTGLRDMTGCEGLVRGGMHVFGMPSGGGKTVLCSQLMVDAAMQGKHVLCISTEMDEKNYRARFISYASWKLTCKWMMENAKERLVATKVGDVSVLRLDKVGLPAECPYEPVPYFLLKVDGTKASKWTDAAITANPEKSARMRATIHKVYEDYYSKYFHFSRIESFKGKWERNLDWAVAQVDDLALVCLDWLGGSIDEAMDDQKSVDMRQAYILMSNRISDLAVKYNFAAVTTTQLNDDATNNPAASISHFGECKSVKNSSVFSAAISCVKVDVAKKLVAKEAGKDESAQKQAADAIKEDFNLFAPRSTKDNRPEGWAMQQRMNCGKSRYGKAGDFKVLRYFDYQFFYNL